MDNINEQGIDTRRRFLQKAGVLTAMPFLVSFGTYKSSLKRAKTFKVLTCNIRVDLPEDEEKGRGWKQRREACVRVIKNQEADVIGFQEVLSNQFLDLKKFLPGYIALGFDGPEMDKYKEGYHGIAKNPILFSKKRFELLNAGGYWLSETPLVAGSLSWESARARNASWVRLYDKETDREFRVVNLHLDHVKNEAKLEQIKMVLQESAQYPSEFVQILTGDFNSGPDSQVVQAVLDAGWKDSYAEVYPGIIPETSTNGFKPHDAERNAKAKKIDFIFVKGPVCALQSTIIKEHFKGVYPSDHYFVDAVLDFS